MEKKPDFEWIDVRTGLPVPTPDFAEKQTFTRDDVKSLMEVVRFSLQSQLSEAEKRHKIELSNYAYQIDSAKRDRDKAESENERLLSALKEREWIDVKERYPGPLDADSKGYVLGWDKFQQESHKCQWVDVCQMKMRFTHWQPLPSPPSN